MSAVFSTPAWVDDLTPLLRKLVMAGDFHLVDDVGERHGSWQWTAASGSSWLVVAATPLSDEPPESTGRPPVELAAWTLAPDGSAVIESAVATVTVEAGPIPDRAMTDALISVVGRALRRPSAQRSHERSAETQEQASVTLATGEALAGSGHEVAHIHLLVGSKRGPVGTAFAAALTNQTAGHTSVLAVVAPNVAAKPDTVMVNRVTIRGEEQAVHLFSPAQAAVGRAVVDSVRSGVIPRDDVDDLCLIVSVFLHWRARDAQKVYDYNYTAVKLAISRALASEPTITSVLAEAPTSSDVFAGGAGG